jgi:hypothetical protein
LNLVDEKVLRPRDSEQGPDEGLELFRGLDGSVPISVEVEEDDALVSDAFGPQLFGDALHEAGLAASADAGNDLDHPVVMVEAANLLQVVLSREQPHVGPNLHWSQHIKLEAYWGILYRLNAFCPHN